MTDWTRAEPFSLRMGEICAAIPLRGEWEPNNRIALAMASLRLAREHHASIHLLFFYGKYASADALARPLIETGLRTIWLLNEASDPEIILILKGRESAIPLLGDLSGALDKYAKGFLSGRHRGWLDSLTHGGSRALAAQFLEGAERERSKAAMIAHAGCAVAAAGFAVASMLGREDLTTAFERDSPFK